MEEALTLYVDGELPFAEQPALFAHLASCEHCRRTLDSVLRFRRVLREENLALPPAADDAFLKRLAQHKQATATTAPPRVGDRSSVWRERVPLSLRTAVSVAVVTFLMGVFVPVSTAPPADPVYLAWVRAEEELVEFEEQVRDGEPTAVYVFYPGLTIEANKAEEPAGPEAL